MKPSRDHHDTPAAARGLTLIELLAVIVIVSTVTAVGAVGLASTSETARLRALLVDVRDLDAHARLLARAEGRVLMSRAEHGLRLHVAGSEDVAASVTLPDGASAHLIVRDEPTATSIAFDTLGQSVDYDVVIAISDRQTLIHFAGLTGLAREVEP